MAVEVKHATTVVVPDDGTSPVGSDEWNAGHALTQAGQRLLGKPDAGAGATTEIPLGAGLAFSAGALVNADGGAAAAAAAVAAHEAAGDPHPTYLTAAEGSAAFAPLGHGHTSGDISDFVAAARAQIEAALLAGANITITPAGSGATRTLTIAAAGGGGGGGSPGGSTGEVQYNNAGAFAGAADVEIENGKLRLAATADPSAPAAGGLLLYSKSIAGRILPKILGPAGIDTILQVGLSGNSVFMVAPASGTTAPTAWGGTLTTAATMSLQQTIASANPWQATSRKRFQTSTTAGNATGMRTAYTQWFRGNAAGFGGFFFRAQLGMNINLNGGQKFVGLCASTALLAGEPSALVNMIGMGYDSTDASTGNWFLMRNDGSGTATKVDLGATEAARNTTHGYDLIIFCPPGAATEIFVRITNIHTGNVVLDTSYTTDLPAVNTGMAFKAEVRNGAVAAADNLEVAKVYIETDY